MPKLIISGVVTLLVLIGVLNCFTTIDVGERAVVVGFGQIKESMGQGFHFVNPMYSVNRFEVRNNKYETTANAATADIQQADVSVAVNFNIDESKVAEIYSNYGDDFMAKVFAQNVQEAVKSSASKYNASELITKRDDFKAAVKDSLSAKMPNIVIIDTVSITNIKFSDSFNQAVEAKVTAEQNALQAKANLEQKKYEADAITAAATAIEHAGGAGYIQLKWIEKWNGVLPTTQTGNGALINLPIK